MISSDPPPSVACAFYHQLSTLLMDKDVEVSFPKFLCQAPVSFWLSKCLGAEDYLRFSTQLKANKKLYIEAKRVYPKKQNGTIICEKGTNIDIHILRRKIISKEHISPIYIWLWFPSPNTFVVQWHLDHARARNFTF